MGEREAVALLWPDQARPKRGPKPRISLDLIVDGAIELADREGLDAVSMQRIADGLGVTKMSLYRYAPGKAELLALMLDRAFGPAPELAAPELAASELAEDQLAGEASGWRQGLRSWALAMHAALAAHPWAIVLAVGVRPFGPNELAWTEAGLRTLAATPLSGAERLDALATVAIHVRGLIQQSVVSAEVESGVAELMAGVLEAHRDEHPETAAAFAEAAAADQRDQALSFGLERILDGLAQRIDRLSRPS